MHAVHYLLRLHAIVREEPQTRGQREGCSSPVLLTLSTPLAALASGALFLGLVLFHLGAAALSDAQGYFAWSWYDFQPLTAVFGGKALNFSQETY